MAKNGKRRIREGHWTCSVCETPRLKGGDPTCTVCGHVRNVSLYPSEKVIFDLSDPSTIVTDPEKLRDANAGPSWNCGSCGFENDGDADACTGILADGAVCGQPRSGDDAVNQIVRYVNPTLSSEPLSTTEDLANDQTDAVLGGWGDKLYAGVEENPYRMPERTLSINDLPGKAPSQYGDRSAGDDAAAGSWIWKDRFPAVTDRNKRPQLRSDLFVLAKPFVRPAITIAAVAMALFFVILGGKYVYDNYIATQDVPVTITGLTWQRDVEVEEERTFREEAWDIPYGGRYVTERQKWHHDDEEFDHWKEWDEPTYHDVPDGEEEYKCGTEFRDNGNGYGEEVDKICTRTKYKRVRGEDIHHKEAVNRKVPVYRTWYTYDIDRWVTHHHDTLRGDTSTPPVWPKPNIQGPKQREGSRTEAYTATVMDATGRTAQFGLDYAVWSDLTIGKVVTAKQTKRGTILSVEWHEPAYAGR